MSKKKTVATSSDLDAHIASDWKTVHGIWNNIRSLLVSAPTQKATPSDLVSVLTWDAAWHDADLSSYTSSTARWAICCVACRRTVGNYDADPQFGQYGATTPYIVLKSTNADDDMGTGSVVWIPMDSQQRFSYKLPSNDLSGQRVFYVIGYM